MFTLPCHKHNPIKVTLKNGEVILARITRFNEATGKVCWIDKGEKWKGTTHCTKVVKATPEEVLAWSKVKEDTMAPVDPIMKDWAVGPMKRGPMMMEGYYFASTVTFRGTRVGKIVDRGDGGMVDLEFKDLSLHRQFGEDANKWAVANGGDAQDGYEEFWAWYCDERPTGKDAKTFFKEKKDEMEKYLATHKPIHTGNLALVNGQI